MVGDIDTNTTYSNATTTTAGLMSATDKTKLNGIESGAQVNTVTGIKGNSESTYRVGNVNITKANIGLGNVDNTADANKSVSHAATATKLATARTINIQDSSATNTGTGASFDGSGNATIKLPATIKANITGNCTGSSGSCTGNAATASKAAQLTTARTIDGVSFNGTANITHYGTCSTAAATVEKTVACTGFTLATGAEINVKFTVTNTAANPTLNVNSTGAKAIYYRGAAISAGYLAANRTYRFVYNGTQYELIGDLDTNTNNATAQNISTTNATYPILLGNTANATANIGNKAALFGKGVKVNPSTSEVIATKFTGALTGNVTGNCSGSSGSCTGNAATATRATYDENGVRISTNYAPQAQIDYLANVATNSVSAAVAAKNDAVAAKNQAQSIADGLVSIRDTAVDTSLTISGQAADSKTVGDKFNVIGATQTTNNEYLCVWVDSQNHVLFGVKADGTFTFQKGVPKPINDELDAIKARLTALGG